MYVAVSFCFFFFNDTATTEIYTLSLHDALPIYSEAVERFLQIGPFDCDLQRAAPLQLEQGVIQSGRSEEHTSELQSH